MAEQDEEPVAT